MEKKKKELKISTKLVHLHDVVVSGGEHVDEIIGAAVADGKVTPKVQSLIKILLKYQHTEDFRAIIFVERVVAALVLPKVSYVNAYKYIMFPCIFTYLIPLIKLLTVTAYSSQFSRFLQSFHL